MAEFEMKCPHCGELLTVQDDWAGMDAECPSCEKTFKIDLKPGKLPDPRKKSSGNCNLVIDNYETEKRIDVIAAIRELKNTELSETLNLIDNLPATLLENVSAEQAEDAKRQLEEIGAHVHLENRKSSAPQAEKKKRTAPRSSGKQQIRHNNQKSKGSARTCSSQSDNNDRSDRSNEMSESNLVPRKEMTGIGQFGCIFGIVILLLGAVSLIFFELRGGDRALPWFGVIWGIFIIILCQLAGYKSLCPKCKKCDWERDETEVEKSGVYYKMEHEEMRPYRDVFVVPVYRCRHCGYEYRSEIDRHCAYHERQ